LAQAICSQEHEEDSNFSALTFFPSMVNMRLCELTLVAAFFRLCVSYPQFLNKDNYVDTVKGKKLLIMFTSREIRKTAPEAAEQIDKIFAKVRADYKLNKDVVVATVDCAETASQLLCQAEAIQQPCIKMGVKGDLKVVVGNLGQVDSYTLSDMAEKFLGDSCGPKRLNLCSEKTKAMWEKHLERSPAAVKATLDKRFQKLVDMMRKANAMGEEIEAKYGEELQTNEALQQEVAPVAKKLTDELSIAKIEVYEANRQFLKLYKYQSGKEYVPRIELTEEEKKAEASAFWDEQPTGETPRPQTDDDDADTKADTKADTDADTKADTKEL